MKFHDNSYVGLVIILSITLCVPIDVVIASQHAYENECNCFTTGLQKP